jgi:hypothetical protein
VVEIPDERLIDHALGLEDDPELEQELTRSEELRERLQLLEADLSQIDRELHGVLPPVEEGWADLSRERWRRLQPFLEPPATRRSRSLRSRLLAPAIALIVVAALLAGVFTLRDVGPQSTRTPAGDAALAPESAGASSAMNKAVSGLAAGYDQVVVAQAGAVQDGRQPYEVVRVLKGPAPASFTVDLGSAAGVPEGSLQVVYLDRLSSPGPKAQDGHSTLGGEASGATAAPSRQNGDFGAGAEPTVRSPRAVTVDGRPALVQPLPSGVDPDTLSVP